jgi:hypothetical protein
MAQRNKEGIPGIPGVMDRGLTHISGNADLYTYTTYKRGSDYLRRRIPQAGNTDILLEGPKDNLRVILRSSKQLVILNDLAPQDTIFSINEYFTHGPVKNNWKTKQIEISPGKKRQDILTYGLLHTIARLQYYSDQDNYSKSIKSHDFVLPRLQNDGVVDFNSVNKDDMLVHWKNVAEEERAVSMMALDMVRRLLSEGLNVLPNITSYRQLTELVNSPDLYRTAWQVVINPDLAGKNTGIPMTLSESEVTKFMERFPSGPSGPSKVFGTA